LTFYKFLQVLLISNLCGRLDFFQFITCSGPVYPVNILGTMHCIAYLIIVNPICIKDRGRGHCPPLEINSGKLKIICRWNLVKTFFTGHLNPKRKKEKILKHLEIFWFEHLGRFIVPL